MLDRHRTEGDENRPQDQRNHHTYQQHFLLIGFGHVERGHDDDKHKQVVDRQAFLRDVAGKVFHAVLTARYQPQPATEDQCDHDIKHRPARGFAQRRLVRRAHVSEEIEYQ